MAKRVISLNEAQFHKLVGECAKRVLRESGNYSDIVRYFARPCGGNANVYDLFIDVARRLDDLATSKRIDTEDKLDVYRDRMISASRLLFDLCDRFGGYEDMDTDDYTEVPNGANE